MKELSHADSALSSFLPRVQMLKNCIFDAYFGSSRNGGAYVKLGNNRYME